MGGANMAAEGDVDLDLEAEENCTGKPAEKPRKHDSGAADLERVTDYAEEKEISSSDLETAMSVIGDRRSREQKAQQERGRRTNYVRDGDFEGRGRTQSAGTHGERGGGSGGSDQLNKQHLHTGLLHFVLFFFFLTTTHRDNTA